MLDGKIVAALNKTVVIYNYVETTEKSADFTKLATFRSTTVPIDLSVTGNIIAVADLMQSISIVEFIPGKGGLVDRLEQVARDYQACWSTAVTYIGEDSWLESDHDGNLLVLKRNVDGLTLQDRKRMEVTSEMNLGEQVNMIRDIDVDTSPTAMVVPKAFLATVCPLPNSNIAQSNTSPDRRFHLPLLDHPPRLPGYTHTSSGENDIPHPHPWQP